MRQHLQELYNALHQARSNNLSTKIISLTAYTRVNLIQKDCAFFKHFISTNQMIAHHPRIYVHANTSYENSTAYNPVTSTVPYNYTYKDTLTRTST